MSAKTYQSPTTPDLVVSFQNFVVETVCLMARPEFGPRFWKDGRYGARKYATESRAFVRFAKMHEDLDDPLTQRAIIDVVKQRWMPTLLLKDRALQNFDRAVAKRRDEIAKGAEATAAKAVTVAEGYMERNTAKAPDVEQSRAARLRGIESGERQNTGEG